MWNLYHKGCRDKKYPQPISPMSTESFRTMIPVYRNANGTRLPQQVIQLLRSHFERMPPPSIPPCSSSNPASSAEILPVFNSRAPAWAESSPLRYNGRLSIRCRMIRAAASASRVSPPPVRQTGSYTRPSPRASSLSASQGSRCRRIPPPGSPLLPPAPSPAGYRTQPQVVSCSRKTLISRP